MGRSWLGPLLRRIPLLVVVVSFAWLFFGEGPREVTLVYVLPDNPPPVRVDVTIRDDRGEMPAAISFGNSVSAAPDRQEQRALLSSGNHRLVATLRYASGVQNQVVRELLVTHEDERIILHL